MQKHTSFTVTIFAAVGILGAVLRYIHIATCYDSSGLPIAGKPITIMLIMLAVLIAAAALIFAIILNAKTMPSFGSGAVSKLGVVGFASQLVSALLLITSSVLRFMDSQSEKNALLLVVLCVLSAVAIIIAAVFAYRGKLRSFVAYLLIVPSLLFCLRLASVFSANISNPVLLTYSFDCVALGAAAVCIFCYAGYALNKIQPFATVFSGLVAVPFSFIAVTGSQSTLSDIMLYLSIILLISPNLVAFTSQLKSKK